MLVPAEMMVLMGCRHSLLVVVWRNREMKMLDWCVCVQVDCATCRRDLIMQNGHHERLAGRAKIRERHSVKWAKHQSSEAEQSCKRPQSFPETFSGARRQSWSGSIERWDRLSLGQSFDGGAIKNQMACMVRSYLKIITLYHSARSAANLTAHTVGERH